MLVFGGFSNKRSSQTLDMAFLSYQFQTVWIFRYQIPGTCSEKEASAKDVVATVLEADTTISLSLFISKSFMKFIIIV